MLLQVSRSPLRMVTQRNRPCLLGSFRFLAAFLLVLSILTARCPYFGEAFAGRVLKRDSGAGFAVRWRMGRAAGGLQYAKDDPWKVLGVDPGSSLPEIKQAYRSLVNQVHPDVNPAPDARERLEEAMTAYKMVSDVEQLQTWERMHAAKKPATTPQKAPRRTQPASSWSDNVREVRDDEYTRTRPQKQPMRSPWLALYKKVPRRDITLG